MPQPLVRPMLAAGALFVLFLALQWIGDDLGGVRPLPATITGTPVLRRGSPPVSHGMLVLAGSLHDHSTDSDGNAGSEEIFRWEYAHRLELGLDYAGLSDHADFFPFAYQAPHLGNIWIRQARLARRYATSDFAVMRAFEYTADQENHLSVIGSERFFAGLHQHDLSIAPFYRWLASEGSDGVGQFNHPSSKGALQWDGLMLDSEAAPYMAAIEVHGDQNIGADNLQHSDAGWYWLALARGWTVGPTMNWDTHNWRNAFAQQFPGEACGKLPDYIPCQRTLIIAPKDTQADLMDALRARRTSATEHASTWATLQGPGGVWQGSTIRRRELTRGEIELTVDAGSTGWLLSSVDIIGDAGLSPGSYYDGDNLLCGSASSSACRMQADDEDGPVSESFLEAHRRWVAAGGHGVRKDQIDEPPPLTKLASVELRGERAQTVIRIPVPALRSPRPDGKHFFYAIVHAGPIRVWTSPIFVDPS